MGKITKEVLLYQHPSRVSSNEFTVRVKSIVLQYVCNPVIRTFTSYVKFYYFHIESRVRAGFNLRDGFWFLNFTFSRFRSLTFSLHISMDFVDVELTANLLRSIKTKIIIKFLMI